MYSPTTLVLILAFVVSPFAAAESFPPDDETAQFLRDTRRAIEPEEEKEREERYRFERGTGREFRVIEARQNSKFGKVSGQRNIVTAELDPNQRYQDRKDRRLASFREPSSVTEMKVQNSDDREIVEAKEVEARLGLWGGVGSLATPNADANAARAEQGLGSNTLLGLHFDVQAWRYLGFEIEAFYGIAPSREIAPATGTGSEPTKKSIQHSGGMGNIKLQLPFHAGIGWVPRIGAGYGLLSLKQEESRGTTFSTADERVSGAYLTGGIDILPASFLMLSFDYAVAPSGSGQYTTTSDQQVGARRIQLQKCRYDRLRFTTQVRLTEGFWLGAQYTVRQIATDLGGAAQTAPSADESISQMMAALIFAF